MDIYAFLTEHSIPYERFDHKAVFTVEESSTLPPMPGAPTKNLFLRDKSGKRHILVSVPHEKMVSLKKLSELLGAKNLSFASPERLKYYLGVEPGSVTLLGAVNDKEHVVEIVIDEEIWNADALQCHPLVNTGTLVITREGMEKFFAATGHAIHVHPIPSGEPRG